MSIGEEHRLSRQERGVDNRVRSGREGSECGGREDDMRESAICEDERAADRCMREPEREMMVSIVE
jgi:hypothetical protein